MLVNGLDTFVIDFCVFFEAFVFVHSEGKFQLGRGHKSWNIGEIVAEVKLIWNSDSIGQSLVKGKEGFKF